MIFKFMRIHPRMYSATHLTPPAMRISQRTLCACREIEGPFGRLEGIQRNLVERITAWLGKREGIVK